MTPLSASRLSGPTWAVVATVREPRLLLEHFAGHHLGLGATRVYVCLDDADPQIAAALNAIDGCEAIRCDDAYWRHLMGGRPKGREKRQIMNAQAIYARCEADWLIHLDADEFLAADANISDLLALVPGRIAALRTQTLERVFRAGQRQTGVFDGLMRVAARGDDRLQAALGPVAAMTTNGFSGHVSGKSFVRTRLPHMLMGIHKPRAARAAGQTLIARWSASISICHFDGLSRDHWARKTLAYMQNPIYRDLVQSNAGRAAQMAFLEARGLSHAAALDLHDQVKVIDARTEAALRAVGGLIDNPIHRHLPLSAIFAPARVEQVNVAA